MLYSGHQTEDQSMFRKSTFRQSRFRTGLLGLALTVAATTAAADKLLLEGLDEVAGSTSQRPARGTSMESVEARYGSPVSRVSPIGDPPISRWEYPGFTVFFEHEHVIHAVVRRGT